MFEISIIYNNSSKIGCSKQNIYYLLNLSDNYEKKSLVEKNILHVGNVYKMFEIYLRTCVIGCLLGIIPNV